MKDFILRTYKFLLGFLLFLVYKRTLNFHQLIKGKRIAIVGAASSAYNTDKGDYIDSFDFVIRINKAPHQLKDGKFKKDIGTKANILFHSFFENQQSGGGPLDITLYDALGIEYIINPISAYSGFRVTFNFYKKYLIGRKVYHLPSGNYRIIKAGLQDYLPTIGFCALKTAMEGEFSELYITGFTFFKTAFGAGYRDDMKEAHQVQKYIADKGLHNPDLEFKSFVSTLAKHRSKNIVMDDVLKSIVDSYQANNL
jgi:hypothetical protein